MKKKKKYLYRRNSVFFKVFAAGILSIGLLFQGCSKAETTDIAMITDGAGVDDQSYNQAAWEAVQQYGAETEERVAFYQPQEATRKGYGEAIEQGLDSGADTIICPGEGFETVVYEYQRENLNTKFILLDGVPHAVDGDREKLRGNTHSILFSKRDLGFLAGYIAVKEGFTNLGYLGSVKESSAAKEYGVGYVLGADIAAGEMGLTPGTVQMHFGYAGRADAAPAVTEQASAWYAEGVQVMFSDNASILNCIGKAAVSAGTRFFAVDEAGEAFSSQRIVNIKGDYKTAAYRVLQTIKEEKYQGGEKETMGLLEGAVQPDWNKASFAAFNQEQYNALVAAIQAGTIILPEDVEELPKTVNVTLNKM